MLKIDWQPAKKSGLPLYRQIYLYMRDKILGGEWPAEAKLPPQREMAKAFGVNRSTLCTALEELGADGYLRFRQGSGSYVNAEVSTGLTRSSRSWSRLLTDEAWPGNQPLVKQINEWEFNPRMIRLGTGELSPKLIPVEKLQRLMTEAAPKVTSFGYQEPLGCLRLREEVSSWLKLRGINVSPNGILIVSGALQALHLISFGLLAPKDSIFIERPSYFLSLRLFRSLQLHFSALPMEKDGLSLNELRLRQSNRRHALLITNPTFHNPTGAVMSLQRRRELLQFCQQACLPIVEDDVYRDLWIDELPPPPLKAIDKNGLVLYVSSLSKTIGPGLRIGWIAGPESIVHRLADLKMEQDYGSSILSQQLAAEWLHRGYESEQLALLRTELKMRRGLMLDMLSRYFADIADWEMPAGGFYIWLRLKGEVQLSLLFRRAAEQYILLNPGSIYDTDQGSSLRLSYAYAEPEEMRGALQKLSSLLHSMLK